RAAAVGDVIEAGTVGGPVRREPAALGPPGQAAVIIVAGGRLAGLDLRHHERVAGAVPDVAQPDNLVVPERCPEEGLDRQAGREVGERAVAPLVVVQIARVHQVVVLGDVVLDSVEGCAFRGGGNVVAGTGFDGDPLAGHGEIGILLIVRVDRVRAAGGARG